ncbi:unnamed protein product [Rotaria socialis]|uniref:Uncharacterized protein n=1 Tax=Rotaria socialis TaxID=392032 RepID=A0A821IAL8_9BILA|nr:unnamed protein product [Rotaria socialis]CAF3543508.1 unnamed protein product [Rotaria socialis]CAF4421123.1 unnamed protein product [Rotaria socialis]CAF4462546.1 unnamed protein product [Rotaria socialis]CAF4598638.1 unnamed protein product [Rotaria socialis]
MNDVNLTEKGKNIWSRISLDELVSAIASLENYTDQLKDESWRLNAKNKSSSSLWGKVIDKLQLDHSETTRQALYKIWRSESHDIRKLVERKKIAINSDDDNGASAGDPKNLEKKNVILHSDPSLPLPSAPNTRLKIKENGDHQIGEFSIIREASLVFTPSEWKDSYSMTHQKVKPGWTDMFYRKLISCGVKCSLRFKTPYIKKGTRKRACNFFCSYAVCTIGECSRQYQVSLKNHPDENSSALFLVRMFGEENHDASIATSARQLRGESRFLVGKRANEIGPLGVFREHINSADRELLAAGNYTDCQTIETLKKAASDYRQKMHIDEEVFRECRIIGRAYRKADTTSEYIQGYIQLIAEMPFRAHLFSELQVKRYVNYCKHEKYSYVNIDATGGILKKMHEQKRSLLYALLFKDGVDAYDTVSLAHSILTDHTVPSISYFLGNLAHNISEVEGKLVLPSFFITDFSAAIMNAILQAFNGENINAHLNRCWNVLHGKYSAQQMRSLSFIRLCCCHVIHAIARSLSAARIDKTIRRAVLHIFAFILCSDDINQLYDSLGLIINIFGNPKEQNAKEKLERMAALQLNTDEESISLLSNDKKIFKKAKKKNDELRLVDEYFRSNSPIIHQSPFNKEAIRRYPNLSDLIKSKSKYSKADNPLFSPSIIRIFYRWWAYLPLWTGLLCNFEERYANDKKKELSVTHHPVRYSNAAIESYFRTFKQSICKGKKGNRPSDIIMELQRSVKAQAKANEFGITQSSKGRRRKKVNVNIEENWGKRTGDKKTRTPYFKEIDKRAAKRARSKVNQDQSDNVTKKLSESDDSSTISSLDPSSSSSEESEKQFSSNRSCSASSTSRTNLKVSTKNSNPILNDSGKPTADDDEQSDVSIEPDSDTYLFSSITNTMYPITNESKTTVDQLKPTPPTQFSSQPEAIIDGLTIRWPKFGLNNVIFEGQSYSLTLTCPIDSALFVLYFLYKTDVSLAGELDDAPQSSPYSKLVETFKIVEKEGWDTARIYWLLTFNILKRSDRRLKSLFGSVDEQVFCFLKNEQRHSNKIICTRPDCKEKERFYSTTELSIRACDKQVVKFEEEVTGVCQTTMKRLDEITKAEALENKYKDARVPIINYETNTSEYLDVWVCDNANVHEAAAFDYGYPPMLIANIERVARRNEEGYPSSAVRLRDVKRIIEVGCVKYQLRAVIHNKNDHFTATLINSDNTLYVYDDLRGVREVRTSTDEIEMGIYTQIHEF